jgi:sporulation protein YlmC with PRC-barrel domain
MKHIQHKQRITSTISIADLIGSKIVTAEGKKIGHVVDIEVTHGPVYEVTGLVFGRYAWLYRFDVLYPFARAFGLDVEPDTIPWHAVERFEQFTVILKPTFLPPSSSARFP